MFLKIFVDGVAACTSQSVCSPKNCVNSEKAFKRLRILAVDGLFLLCSTERSKDDGNVNLL